MRWTGHVRIWKEEMIKTHINGKRLGDYTEINIIQNNENQPSDTHQKHNGQNKAQYHIF